jgi:RNA 2',3'-cyclic 3'-phosphodiesterase
MNRKGAASMNSNENFTRTFVALDLPESVKSYLEDNFSYCRNLMSDAKWVNPRAIHLTLKFLGNVPTKAIPSIAQALEEGFDGQTPIKARLSGIGMFPNFERPRVLWAGITDEGLLLANLFHRIEKCLIPLGFAREKRSFRAHLTLARIKPGSPTQGIAEAFKRCMPFTDLTFELDKASFYQSVLKSHGAEYTVLKTFLFT